MGKNGPPAYSYNSGKNSTQHGKNAALQFTNEESLEREYLEYEKLNHIDKDFLNTDREIRLKHSRTKL